MTIDSTEKGTMLQSNVNQSLLTIACYLGWVLTAVYIMYMVPTLIQQGTGTETKCILDTITNWQLHAWDMTPNTLDSSLL